MTVFDDDGEIFLDPDLFGESIVILPDGVTARTVIATVVRRPPQLDDNGRRTLESRLQIRVANNATTGLALSELVLGKTMARVAPRLGQATEDYYVHIPDDGQPWQDGGMIRLWLR